MKSLEKRLQKIEQQSQPKKDKPLAHVAIINDNGTVTIKRPNNGGTFELPSEKALDAWMDDNNMNEFECLRVIVVNSKGEKPTVS